MTGLKDTSFLSGIPFTLDAFEKLIRDADPVMVQKLLDTAKQQYESVWLPQPGPQTHAYHSPADETLYGGAVGGGKSDLLIGLATTAHQRSLIFRAQSKDLDGFWDRLNEVVVNPARKNDTKRSMTTRDGRLIEGGHLGEPGSERNWQGRPHDLIGFDEAAQLDEMRVAFVMQWLRSTDRTQRKRVVFATNPPMPEIKDGKFVDTGVGDWLLRWFAPWVDDLYPNPAKPGEIRWCFMKAVGDRLETIWVEGPGAYDPETHELRPDATARDIETGKVSVAKSRTFIKSLLKDNAFLAGTGYAEKLSATPEPMKSMLLNGDFTIRGEDHPFQVIPTQWVIDAQERWKAREESDILRLKQLVLYADIAQGGIDTTVIASLCETDYFDELLTQPGSATPTGREVGALLLDERMDGSMIVLDATGGWAGSTAMFMSERHKIECEMHTVSKTDGTYEPNGIYKYSNLRSKMWWEFRLALDPKSGYRICLPPGSRLRTQLCAPHFAFMGKEIHIESKDELRKRLGSSTDEADAVLGAWQYRDGALQRQYDDNPSLVDKLNGRTRKPYKGNQHPDSEDYDPRGDW